MSCISIIFSDKAAEVSHSSSQSNTLPQSETEEDLSWVELGATVLLKDRTPYSPAITGVIQYVGTTEFASGIWVGLILDSPKGKNNGKVLGKAYFSCAPNYGLFVRPAQISLLSPAPKVSHDNNNNNSNNNYSNMNNNDHIPMISQDVNSSFVSSISFTSNEGHQVGGADIPSDDTSHTTTAAVTNINNNDENNNNNNDYGIVTYSKDDFNINYNKNNIIHNDLQVIESYNNSNNNKTNHNKKIDKDQNLLPLSSSSKEENSTSNLLSRIDSHTENMKNRQKLIVGTLKVKIFDMMELLNQQLSIAEVMELRLARGDAAFTEFNNLVNDIMSICTEENKISMQFKEKMDILLGI